MVFPGLMETAFASSDVKDLGPGSRLWGSYGLDVIMVKWKDVGVTMSRQHTHTGYEGFYDSSACCESGKDFVTRRG
jgi:hypothetical protein